MSGVTILLRNAGYFLEFLNPIRKSDFLPRALLGITDEAKVPTLAIITDSASKVFNTYLIYQLVAAFRKHGKKSD